MNFTEQSINGNVTKVCNSFKKDNSVEEKIGSRKDSINGNFLVQDTIIERD